jgi:hypothetical protein
MYLLQEADLLMSNTPGFGDIIQTRVDLSETQLSKREFGRSPVKLSGNPSRYHAGDTVNLPFGSGETSTISAMGAAWAATITGGGPA